jgi:PAS domain S-box-containing protein
MRWWYVYLLGTVTLLTIALRRVVRRQKPLNDELYSSRVATVHVHSGVAWVRNDGRLGSVNAALARALGTTPQDLVGHEWVETIFSKPEWNRIREAYSRMLIQGRESLEANAERADGSLAQVDVRLVAVHDHRMRFVGHHCLVEDRTEVHVLEEQVRELTEALKRQSSVRTTVVKW